MDMNKSLRPTVTTAIAVLFEAKDRETITEMLTEECSAERLHTTSADAVEPIQLGVLKLSNGEVGKFLAAAKLTQIDWRDMLVAAGFGEDVKAHLKWADSKITHTQE